jgi:hypothetical protein
MISRCHPKNESPSCTPSKVLHLGEEEEIAARFPNEYNYHYQSFSRDAYPHQELVAFGSRCAISALFASLIAQQPYVCVA